MGVLLGRPARRHAERDDERAVAVGRGQDRLPRPDASSTSTRMPFSPSTTRSGACPHGVVTSGTPRRHRLEHALRPALLAGGDDVRVERVVRGRQPVAIREEPVDDTGSPRRSSSRRT